MNRSLALIGSLLVGYIVGGIVIMIPIMLAALIFPMPKWVWQFPFSMIGGLVGVGVMLVKAQGQSNAPPLTSHGSARFSRRDEDQATLGGEGLIVGRSDQGWLMRYGGPAHLLTIAPTRSGKGVGAIIPNLLTAERSVLCIDPKGENARITARARRRMGPVFVLDPFEISGQPTAAFNPLAALEPESPDLAEDAAMIAEALVYDPPHQVGEAHWNEEAKALIAGMILNVVTAEHPEACNLATVRDLLTSSPERFIATLDDMQASDAVGGLVARAANRHFAKSEREAAGVLSAAQRHTHFLDSPRMGRVMSGSDFAFQDLKSGVATVFLVLPPDRMAAYARWLRLLVVQSIGALARAPASPRAPHFAGSPKPVLLMLDEFAALGHLEPAERAFGLMAGYGVQLWAILQDLHQLRSTYGQHAGTFLSNAGVIQVFNVADVDTATWVSRSLGSTTQMFQTTSSSRSRDPRRLLATTSESTSVNLMRRELMTPDEVMRMSADRLLIFRPGEAATIALKIRYYQEIEFTGLFIPDG